MKPLDWHKKRNSSGMPAVAELVLNVIHNEGPLTVMDAMGSSHSKCIASMTTIHGGLKWLREFSYIKIQTDKDDSRTKVCQLTAKGNKYLEVV